MAKLLALLILLLSCAPGLDITARTFVSINGHTLYADGRPYYFVGANYWYGGLLGLEKDKHKGIGRLRHELDTLKANGVTNLRLMAGVEGIGLINGVMRVGPPLQPEQGKFDDRVLDGLDLVLAEIGKRRMRAVIFLSNNWEWSGGFQQYLMWNGLVSDEYRTKKPTWDELRDIVAKFYSCKACIDGYNEQVRHILSRLNRYTGKRYVDDSAIMAWELANEPRPMRPIAAEDYSKWIASSAAFIKSLDKRHLVTIGHEGWIGTESNVIYKAIHSDPNIDYLTIHIWPKNWGWFTDGRLADGFARIVSETEKYIGDNAAIAARLDKPLVIEEFGLPRDGQSLDPASATTFRDKYYGLVLDHIGGNIAGANFWAFGGTARPNKGQVFWLEGDDRMGDPPMEEQGLNSVFDTDRTTLDIIRRRTRSSIQTK